MSKCQKRRARVRMSCFNLIEVNEYSIVTKLPESKLTFWSSSTNKTKLQEALRSYTSNEGNEKTELVASTVGQPKNIKLYLTNRTGCSEKVLNLNLEIKEADVHLIPNALESVERGTAYLCPIIN